jgi:hypothetical protein
MADAIGLGAAIHVVAALTLASGLVVAATMRVLALSPVATRRRAGQGSRMGIFGRG